MSEPKSLPAAAGNGARLLVVLMGIGWGMNWIATRAILQSLSPWQMRVIGVGLGALVLFIAGAVSRTPLSLPRGERLKVLIAALFNVGIFNICSAYSQVYGTTSRAVVIAYSMPIWASVLAWLVLKERLTGVKLAALALCAIGLAILIGPLIEQGLPLGALFALGCAWCWAAGTIYLKMAQIKVPTLTSTAWQLLLGWLMLLAGMLTFDHLPHIWPLPTATLLWIGYNGLIGMGLIYFVWFVVVDKLPTMTASIGSLLVPVVGVIGSATINGERPDLTDTIGFALIFAAAATVLLQPNAKHDELPE
ncbi:MAG TPA: DMT family transporter [Pseudolabrys sp.]|nr:DMT family transporter [Pseudolabrys sp.]